MGYYDLWNPEDFVTNTMVDISRDSEIDHLDLMLVFNLISGVYPIRRLERKGSGAMRNV